MSHDTFELKDDLGFCDKARNLRQARRQKMAPLTRILSGLGQSHGKRACDERALERLGRLGSNRLDG